MATRRLLRIRLPPPHAKQAEIEACVSSRVVVNCGRRAGKTFMVARKSVKKAGEGRKVLYAAPVASQTDTYWELLTEWLADAIKSKTVIKNETKRILTFPGDGRIVARTAYKPDHMRGTWTDYLILDEFAYQNPDVWFKVGMPMLLDNGGTVIFPSTPDGRNHFYHLFLRCKDDPRWAGFQFSSLENPHLSREALAELTEDMTEVDYAQEILAEFVEGAGQVFSLNYEDFQPADDWETIIEKHAAHRIVAGLDWGQIKDSTVHNIGCAVCSQELEIDRFQETDYPTQRSKIKQTYKRYKEVGMEMEILAESNAMGLPNIEQLRVDGVPVNEIAMSSSSKPQMVQALRLVFANRAWQWIDDDRSIMELEAYEATASGQHGNLKYGAPQGLHDDLVVGKMLMNWQALQGTFTLV